MKTKMFILYLETYVVGVLFDTDQNNTRISGFVIDHIFHGEITLSNGTVVYFEDPVKYPNIHKKCLTCPSFTYTKNDYINIWKGKEVYRMKQVNFSADIERKSKNIYKSIAYQKLHENFVKRYLTLSTTIAQISGHIRVLNKFLSENFQDNQVLQYHIKYVKVFGRGHELDAVKHSPEPLLVGAVKLSENTDVCTTGVYVSEDWDEILGYAHLGNSIYGLCNIKSAFVVTSILSNTQVSDAILRSTTVHEIGHNLGSEHDPEENSKSHTLKEIEECSSIHRYVMAALTSDVEDENNLKFSPCSIKAMRNIINIPRRRKCLKGFLH
ncbi:Disintegrin and metalloproteinase domain-containing protein 10 [Thelohanellus kitauei]|uniref:Disintegrin and metalloproteinase domain-containing protein 10 n=1 Tax=Thelohanellus kitauei TaxID=669202 RepID=A0A0C2IXS3_THEKT|nr:Disintegrin and metalloproteinase domain-containing protein 10 [Thelohanellus kitauei]